LREPLAYKKKKFLYASLNNKVSIAREKLLRIKKGSAERIEIMVAVAAGWLHHGNSKEIMAP